ncbi:unnamed protein product [Trichogramma brassicae]|uniref:Uncharacterized protein n=1 Tax=Trichogramma brassicae TaxID=86971 RepID=A0A6H5IWA9_9HYME|nr:unnamed protein product [Trichogramma brassicae]
MREIVLERLIDKEIFQCEKWNPAIHAIVLSDSASFVASIYIGTESLRNCLRYPTHRFFIGNRMQKLDDDRRRCVRLRVTCRPAAVCCRRARRPPPPAQKQQQQQQHLDITSKQQQQQQRQVSDNT